MNGARLDETIGDGAFAGVIRMHLVPGLRFSEFYLGGFANEAVEHHLALHDDRTRAQAPLERARFPRLRQFGIVTGT